MRSVVRFALLTDLRGKRRDRGQRLTENAGDGFDADAMSVAFEPAHDGEELVGFVAARHGERTGAIGQGSGRRNGKVVAP